ncbi:MAG TPA: FAD-dependent oxidoreductase [Solirubrobacteraceae bacterium]|nr:FAD-dependent oxidoreductase [Solirubrobacteraceae bacterium]
MPDERVDVLVAGFGPAGASAALAAQQAGATVLVAEKTRAGGGNCRHSGGFLFAVDGPSAIDHLDALCFGKTDRAVLEAYADGTTSVAEWITSLGGHAPVCDPDAFGGLLPSWPSFPGAGHVTYRQFDGGDTRPGIALWELLESATRDQREIDVRTETPVTALVIEDGAVRGAVLGGEGGPRTVQAGAVVLASGGMEYDADMRDGYLPLPLTPVGHPGNTGDSVRLAAQAGASLWHMAAYFGWLAFAHPDFPAAFTINVHAPSFVLIDDDGRRFADELGWEVHDQIRSWTTYQPRRPNRPRPRGFVVFDEAARLAGPLNGLVGTPNDHHWSADNSAELDAGWIARGDSSRALARAISVDPDVLEATLAQYRESVAAGRDQLFDRAAETLVALEPPLYALPIVPGVATASGGPRRDAHARVLRAAGNGYAPIDGLYAAGGAGSIWGHLTEHGGGLTDAIVFGGIAGTHAATL